MGNKSSKIISSMIRIKGGNEAVSIDSTTSKTGSKRAHAEEMTSSSHCGDDDTDGFHSPER